MYESYEPEGFEYVVQPDDTISNLADQYYLAEEDLINANPEVDFEALYVGQVINIPEAASDEQPEQARPTPPARTTVPARPSDRRDRFDRRYRYGPYDRRRFQCPRGAGYRVRPGDSLYRIARRFNVPIRELMNLNRHINFNYPLEVGDVLCIPYQRLS
jgi:peptidoglycan endopeptidase LytF